jgi:hypothetical protein
MAEFKNMSFRNVSAIFGIIEIQGFAEGDDVISITQEADQFSDIAGAKGDVVRTQSSDNRCTVTIKLLQTASSNKDLLAAYNVDKESGVGVVPMIIEDKEAGETYVINNAWITKIPDVTRGANPNSMDWVFRGDFLTGVIV